MTSRLYLQSPARTHYALRHLSPDPSGGGDTRGSTTLHRLAFPTMQPCFATGLRGSLGRPHTCPAARFSCEPAGKEVCRSSVVQETGEKPARHNIGIGNAPWSW